MCSKFLRSTVFLVLALFLYTSAATAAPRTDVNTATVEQLQQVKGIGPKTAEKIVTYREENGKFASLDELQNIRGIGAKSLDTMTESLSLE